MSEQNAYILGTDPDELFRLGVQHQVWSSEAQKGWSLAGFTAGQKLLDLGCGPGFCTKELALIVGKTGEVIGIDLSENYIRFIDEFKKLFGLNINAIASDFNDMTLKHNSLDGAYCRWALAWISNPEDIVKKVFDALKPGGRFVIHEYIDWMTHRTIPSFPSLSKGIKSCFQSFEDSQGAINIGRDLSGLLTDAGYKLVNTRLMAKIARPADLEWQWPKTFYQTYFTKLCEMGYLTKEEVANALNELAQLESLPNAQICCPLMTEIIVEK